MRSGFNSIKDAKTVIKFIDNLCWKYIRKHPSSVVDRFYYCCPDKDCDMKAYIHVNPKHCSADIYRTDRAHDHNTRNYQVVRFKHHRS